MMMMEFTNSVFSSAVDRGEALVLEDMSFTNCVFKNSELSLTKDIRLRAVLRNVSLKDCTSSGCGVGPALLEGITVDGLATNDLLIIWGADFNRVKLTGQIGKLKINPFVHHIDRSQATQGPFDEHRRMLYESIEWALDISSARFKEFDVRGVPARLIRTDPETQVVVTRERALSPGWRSRLSEGNRLWPFMIDQFVAGGAADTVLVAPLGAAKAKRDALLQGLKELRNLGVAEPC